ncbi:DUF7547 family protein [Halomarina litorea]|uniref:DUF7547 family protein n=1 Tax=Halomarina litorea TaxID=2961595 RepID=UPI0020C2E18A|nr:hypothetical protein [Halomarina sp. BCD28]
MSDGSTDDDLRHLLDDLSTTLDALRGELDDRDRDGRERSRHSRARRTPSVAPPRPGRFLRFTEEYTIPTLVSFLEANIRALELLQGLLGILNGSDDSRVERRQFEALGGRTMDQLDGVLTDLQDALDGQPTDPDARDLLEDARALRREIDDRIAGRDLTRREERGGRAGGRDRGGRRSRRDGGPVSIDVADAGDTTERPEREDEDAPRDDEVDVDAELDAIRREVHDGEADAGGVERGESGDGDGDEDRED